MLKELLQKAEFIVPGGEYNEVLEQLCDEYVKGTKLPKHIIKKLEQYSPFHFEHDSSCLGIDCTISQMFPRLLEHKFNQKHNIESISKLQYQITLFNVLINITCPGKYFQEMINIPDQSPVPDNLQEMFTLCQQSEWIIKVINKQYNQMKIALYYDDQHILLCDDIIQNIEKLKETNIIFNEDILRFMRYLNRIQTQPINFSLLQKSVQTESFDYYLQMYNIPKDFQLKLLELSQQQQSFTIVSSVGEALRFQEKMQKLKRENKENKEQVGGNVDYENEDYENEDYNENEYEEKIHYNSLVENDSDENDSNENDDNENDSDENNSDENDDNENDSNENDSDENNSDENEERYFEF